MTKPHNFLAMDLGAESGRGELVTLTGHKVEMKEIHRFANRPVRLGNTLYWDFLSLYAEIIQCLKICAARGISLDSISVDTWGVDFGLLDDDGELLGNPVHYRDSRTEGIHSYSNPVMSTDDIFAATGYEPWAISSLFQLLSMQRDKSPLLKSARAFLNMPDLFLYFLTGIKANELSIVNTSNLLGVDCRWAKDIISRFKLPQMFGRLVSPATVLGPLQQSVRTETGLGEVPVIASCGHDTSAAVAAVPGQGDNWAFLSCGTWSIIGALIEKPIATRRCLELGFTNEYTIGGWYLGRNILGLWLIQQLRAKWNSDSSPLDYPRMAKEAAEAGSGPLIDAAHDSLMAPADMEEALLKLIKASGQKAPATRGELIRGVLDSLALEYNWRLDSIGELTGSRPTAVYMVGGGIHNKLLCQLTANACGVAVHAGADQCSALGNALGQALALGILKDPEEIRQVMRASFETTVYQPENQNVWNEKRRRYAEFRKA